MQTDRDGSLCLQRAQLCWHFSWTSPVNLNLKYLQSEVLLMSEAGRTGLEVKKAVGQLISSRNREIDLNLLTLCSHSDPFVGHSGDTGSWRALGQPASCSPLVWASMGCVMELEAPALAHSNSAKPICLFIFQWNKSAVLGRMYSSQ